MNNKRIDTTSERGAPCVSPSGLTLGITINIEPDWFYPAGHQVQTIIRRSEFPSQSLNKNCPRHCNTEAVPVLLAKEYVRYLGSEAEHLHTELVIINMMPGFHLSRISYYQYRVLLPVPIVKL